MQLTHDHPHGTHDHGKKLSPPNEVLAAEVDGLPPGRVLEVGSGNGSDAIWLASKGWHVTAIDISQAAIDGAKAAADGAGLAVTWICGDIATLPLNAGQFDLISIQYPALRRDTHHKVITSLLDAVAPGGIILVTTHGPESDSYARAHGIEPTDYIDTADFAAQLDDRWEMGVQETRRRATKHEGSPFTHDIVLLARRRY